jgi:L-alanine-DL-glutamate epimerase-like enolase superfamily enzyme
MKITDVTLTLFAWDDIPATSYGAHTGKFSGASKLGLLKVVTDQGITGHAFLGSAFFPADSDGGSLIRVLKPLLMGQDPLQRERLYQAMFKRVRTTTVRSIGAVDVALWDIAGQAAGLPIHNLLGTYREQVPAYMSSAVLASPAAYAEEALHYKAQNLVAYKIHPPQAWREDISVCEAVRKAVGDDYLLMLDAAWSYDYPAALRVGLAAQELGYYWYEDPLADNDIYNYLELRRHLHIPIMATEYPAGGLDSFTPWVKERATDYLRGTWRSRAASPG